MAKCYGILYEDEETKATNRDLWMEIKNKGTHIQGGWDGAYWVAKYSYNGKTYELWEDMDLGVMYAIYELD